MNLRSYDVLIVDVTIIVGLLFFISLQSFSSMTVEQTNFDVWTTINEINVENMQTQSLIEEFCLDNDQNLEDLTFTLDADTDCDRWYNQVYINNAKLDAIEKRVLDIYSTKGFTFEKYSASANFYLFGAPLIAAGISFSMIIPFAVSAVFISINAMLRKEDKTLASKYGVISMIIGFAMLIIGITLIISIMFCSVFLPLACGVEDTLTGIVADSYPGLGQGLD